MIALSPRWKPSIHGHVGSVLLIVYQAGLAATACLLAIEHVGRCTAVFNCMVLLAADLFRAIVWPLYWSIQVLTDLLA